MNEILAHPLRASMVAAGISLNVLAAVLFDIPGLMIPVIFPGTLFLCSGRPARVCFGAAILVFFFIIHSCDLTRFQMERSGFLHGFTVYGGTVLMLLAVLHWCFRKNPAHEEIS